MGRIGFDISGEKKETKKEQSVWEHVQHVLQSEIISCQEFENTTIKELKEIKDIESNLKLVIQQVKHITTLMDTKEELVKNLLNEGEKSSGLVNLSVCLHYTNAISQMDYELKSQLVKIEEELVRLRLNETHHLFNESAHNKKRMKDIDRKARKLYSSVAIMKGLDQSFDGHIQRIQYKISVLQKERANRPTGKIGFDRN